MRTLLSAHPRYKNLDVASPAVSVCFVSISRSSCRVSWLCYIPNEWYLTYPSSEKVTSRSLSICALTIFFVWSCCSDSTSFCSRFTMHTSPVFEHTTEYRPPRSTMSCVGVPRLSGSSIELIIAHVLTEKHFCSNLSAVKISVSSSFSAITYGTVLWLELFLNFSSKLVSPCFSWSLLELSSSCLLKQSSYYAYVVLWLTSTLKTEFAFGYL